MNNDLTSVINRVIADFEAQTNQNASVNKVIEALLSAYGAEAHALYRYIDSQLQQFFPATASEEYLAIWGAQTATPRLEGESLDAWRERIDLKLQEKNRFGTLDDYIAWAKLADNRIAQAWSIANTPLLGEVRVVLVSNSTLSGSDVQTVFDNINALRPAGSGLSIVQADDQPINITISGVTDATKQNIIEQSITELINTTHINANASLTIAQLHSAIGQTTDEYTLVSPSATITADDYKRLVLGAITWQ